MTKKNLMDYFSMPDEGDFLDDTDCIEPELREPLLDSISKHKQLGATACNRLHDMLTNTNRYVRAYTLTLKPIYHSKSKPEQYLILQRYVKKHCEDTLYYFTAEETLKGNIHLHGIIEVGYDLYRRRVEMRLRRLGHIVSKELTSGIGWYNYISKDCGEYELIHNL